MIDVRVTHRAASRLRDGHLWVYASDVADFGEATGGTVVRVADPKGKALATAHFSSSSQIALRVLGKPGADIDAAFFGARIEAAQALRRRVVEDTDAYRVVHAEGDLLPALIVDRYGPYLCVQTLNQGMDAARETILDVLEALFQPAGIVLRNDAAAREKERLPREVAVARGTVPDSVEVRMNSLAIEADLLRGQKTGIYLDQRENYRAAARHARGRALDCFTSTGGFALHLAAVCSHVEAADSSEAALAAAGHNAARNGIANISFRRADVFDWLGGHAAARRRFDTIVLDPPAFAKSRANVEAAARGYRELHVKALKLLAPGGVLVTCSCSHHVSEALLLETLAAAALDTGHTLRVLERRTQAQDHPILLTVPETHYLKCIIAEDVPLFP